jgi:hypothetical protein
MNDIQRFHDGDKVYLEYEGASAEPVRIYGRIVSLWSFGWGCRQYANVQLKGSSHTWPIVAAQLHHVVEPVTPGGDHDWTPSALQAARRLADDYFPITDRAIDAQVAIVRAVSSGDLEATMEALRQARLCGTPTWRIWHDAWLRAVERHILAKGNAGKLEAA